MTEPRPSQVLGGLSRSRPHRRSQRRPPVQSISGSAPTPAAAAAAAPAPSTAAAPAPTTAAAPAPSTVAAVPSPHRPFPGASAAPIDALGTAVQAAAELAEIGLTVGARTLRNALSRLTHP